MTGSRAKIYRLACVFGLLSLPVAGALGASPTRLGSTWEGVLEAGMQKLRLVLHLTEGKDGAITATLDSPDQGATGIPVATVRFEKGTLELRLPKLGAEFHGQLNETGDEIVGSWRQGGASLPLRLRPVASAPVVRRPQVPTPPLPYTQAEVTFPSRAEGVTLAGTFTVPAGQGPFPAVALLSGSGPSDRDESIFGHKPFLVLAHHLTSRGIAVLRFDDRGVGGSTAGVAPGRATTQDFAMDAAGAVAWLTQRSDVQRHRIGLIGHSEGGLIALLTANSSPDVSFIVMLAGPALPGALLLELQNEASARVAGMPEAQVEALRVMNRRAYAIVLSERDDAAATARLEQFLERAGVPVDRRKAQAESLVSPWFRFFLAHDPAEDLARVKVPLLALYGEKDVQVVAEPHAAAARKALEATGNVGHRVTVLPSLNHLFQKCVTGAVVEYAAIEETMAPVALDAVGDWIESQVGRPGGR